MKKAEKLIKIYERIIAGKKLTTSELNFCGLASGELTKMCNTKELKRIDRGLYILNDALGLYNYGVQMADAGEHEKAFRCFDYCNSIGFLNDDLCRRLYMYYFSMMIDDKVNETLKLSEVIKAHNYRGFVTLMNYIKNNYLLTEEQKQAIDAAGDTLKFLERANEQPKGVKVVATEEIEVNEVISIDDVYASLKNNNLNQALKLLKIFLNQIGQSEYEFLVINLIFLDILDGDTSFIRSFYSLSLILKDSYCFDEAVYLRYYQEALAEKLIAEKNHQVDLMRKSGQEAELYLNILARAKKLGWISNLPNSLEEEIENCNEEGDNISFKFIYPTSNN